MGEGVAPCLSMYVEKRWGGLSTTSHDSTYPFRCNVASVPRSRILGPKCIVDRHESIHSMIYK